MEKIIKSSNYSDAKVVYCMVDVDDTNLEEGVDIVPADDIVTGKQIGRAHV